MGRGSSTPRSPHLCKERHQALVVRELEVLGVKMMESRDVTLNQILLLVV